MEKNMKKGVYTCITEPLCCTTEINTTVLIKYSSIFKTIKKKQPCSISIKAT